MITEREIKHAAEVLRRTKLLTGGDDAMYLPKVFIVEGHCYMYLNVARRAAYGTKEPIYVMTIEKAFEVMDDPKLGPVKNARVRWEFDQTGETFDGRLFDSKKSPLANTVNIPIIPL